MGVRVTPDQGSDVRKGRYKDFSKNDLKILSDSLVTCGEAQVIEWQEFFFFFFFFFFFLLPLTVCRQSSQNLLKSSANLPNVNMEDLWHQDHIMDSVRPFSDTFGPR